MITTVRLVNTFITSHSYNFLCLVVTFKIYYLSKFQIHRTALLIRVTRLYIHPRTYNWKFVHSDHLYPSHLPIYPWQPLFCSVSVLLLRFHILSVDLFRFNLFEVCWASLIWMSISLPKFEEFSAITAFQ